MRRECRDRFPDHRLQRKPPFSDPGPHHSTCIKHLPWCMPGSLTRGGGENVAGIPGACATHNFTYLVRGPFAKTYLHRRSKVSVQAAYGNISTVALKTWLISNDWMTIMLHGCTLLKITYLGTFSIKVCFYKLMLRITNDQSNHRHQITNFVRRTLFEPPLYWNNLWTGLDLLWKPPKSMLGIIYNNMSACRLSTNTPSP